MVEALLLDLDVKEESLFELLTTRPRSLVITAHVARRRCATGLLALGGVGRLVCTALVDRDAAPALVRLLGLNAFLTLSSQVLLLLLLIATGQVELSDANGILKLSLFSRGFFGSRRRGWRRRDSI